MISIEEHLQKLKTKRIDDQTWIWCQIRTKWLVITPEEVVRQSALSYLIELGYSAKHITVERQIIVNQLQKRYDIVVSTKLGSPHILVECKQPNESIKMSALEQASIYNLTLTGRYMWITNGHDNRIFEIDHEQKTSRGIDSLPLP